MAKVSSCQWHSFERKMHRIRVRKLETSGMAVSLTARKGIVGHIMADSPRAQNRILASAVRAVVKGLYPHVFKSSGRHRHAADASVLRYAPPPQPQFDQCACRRCPRMMLDLMHRAASILGSLNLEAQWNKVQGNA